jgi:hypothetical protein
VSILSQLTLVVTLALNFLPCPGPTPHQSLIRPAQLPLHLSCTVFYMSHHLPLLTINGPTSPPAYVSAISDPTRLVSIRTFPCPPASFCVFKLILFQWLERLPIAMLHPSMCFLFFIYILSRKMNFKHLTKLSCCLENQHFILFPCSLVVLSDN